MEEWELDFEFLRVRHYIKDTLIVKELPDMRSILFLVGVQELGQGPREFSKEEKQDLMHIAACTLLEQDGYYNFKGRDEDGWPHWEVAVPFRTKGIKEQEQLLKEKIIQYFKPAMAGYKQEEKN